MIVLRIFIDRIPDTVPNEFVWYLAALETLIEAVLVAFIWGLIIT